MSTMQLTIDAENLLKAIIAQPAKLEKNLDNAIGRVLLVFSRSARNKAPKAFSTLTDSIGITRQGKLEGTTGPAVNYGEAVEKGTGVFGPNDQPSGIMPPVENIFDWIQRVNITPNDPTMDSADLAWAISKTIAEEGTQPQPYMQPAFEDNKKEAERLIDVAITASLN